MSGEEERSGERRAACTLSSNRNHQVQRNRSRIIIKHLKMDRHAAWIADFDMIRATWIMSELLSLRDAVIGSLPLIALIDAGAPPEALSAALSEASKEELAPVFDSINTMVTQLVIGDAVMRSRQTLMPKPPGSAAGGGALLVETFPDWEELEHVGS